MRRTPDLVKGMLRLENGVQSQSQSSGKDRWGYYARDEVKLKLAHKHRILILKPLLQLVIAIKETIRSIIFPNKKDKKRLTVGEQKMLTHTQDVCIGNLT